MSVNLTAISKSSFTNNQGEVKNTNNYQLAQLNEVEGDNKFLINSCTVPEDGSVESQTFLWSISGYIIASTAVIGSNQIFKINLDFVIQ